MSPPRAARDAPEVSVVMPAHNEAGYIDQTLKVLVGALRERSLAFEVVVVENGSTDSTLADARAFAATDDDAVVVLTREHADYGLAMRMGILAARGELVVVFDVDYFDPAFVDEVLPLLAPGAAAIVVGSKRAPGTNDTRPWPRRMITAGFSTILRYGFALQVSDTHGMKAMRREEVTPIVRRCRNGSDLFDTELVLRADRAGLMVAEVPVTVEEHRPSRTPIARRVGRTVVGLVRLRIQLWRERRV